MKCLSVTKDKLESEKSILRTEILQQAAYLNNGDHGGEGEEGSASLYRYELTNSNY